MEGIGHSEAGTTSQKQNKRVRLGILSSHPIQYQAPLFRRLAARRDIDVEVLFCSRWGLRSYLDPQFGVRFSWDVPVLEGYRSRFLMNLSPRRGPNGFFGVINPGVALPMLQKRFDALLLHGWALATNWIALAAAKAVRVPLLLRGESTGFDEPEGVKGAMRRVVLRQMFSGVSAFLAIGTRNARFYRDYDVSSERIFSAPYAVDNSFFSEQAKRLKGSTYRLRQREGIAVDRPLILFAGKLIQKKRPKDLLDAFDRVRTSIAVSLAFVGEGALRPELQRLARDKGIENVHFLGFRNQSEIGKCYAMADVLVLPSSLETWGLVVNEAMCFGLPVITSDRVGAAADLVREGVNGFVYPVGNTVELARCVRDILRDAARRAQMGRESHRLIEKWDLSATVEGISQALRFVTQSIVDS